MQTRTTMRGREIYPGGKAGSGTWQRLITLMPAHENYFEPFLGHGAVILRKKPAPALNVGCDVDAGVIKWWEKRRCGCGWKVDRGATMESLLGELSRSTFHVATSASSFTELRSASPKMMVLPIDAMQILTSHPAMQDPKTLVYLDPPYLWSVRSKRWAGKMYRHEMHTEQEHFELLSIIKRLRCMCMISGYDSKLYRRVLHDWRVADFNAMTRGGLRREFVWMNFAADLPLHDVRYVGDGYRERERIARKRRRWQKRFSAMPPAERQVIKEALESVAQ